MNTERRKQLMEEYKSRRPEMGVISYRCKETGESFLEISRDTRASFNSVTAKLTANYHPNKRLMELWNQYGLEGFELSVIKVLKYEDPLANHTKALEELREQCLAQDTAASKLWK